MKHRFAVLALALALIGCGAKTELRAPPCSEMHDRTAIGLPCVLRPAETVSDGVLTFDPGGCRGSLCIESTPGSGSGYCTCPCGGAGDPSRFWFCPPLAYVCTSGPLPAESVCTRAAGRDL